MNFSIEIDHKNKLIRYSHQGKIKMEEIGLAWDEFLKMEEFTKLGYNLLSDYRNSRFEMKREAIGQIIDILEEIKPIISGKKQSLILDDPFSLAGSILFVKRVRKRTGFIVKVFSTEEAALKWLTN